MIIGLPQGKGTEENNNLVIFKMALKEILTMGSEGIGTYTLYAYFDNAKTHLVTRSFCCQPPGCSQ